MIGGFAALAVKGGKPEQLMISPQACCHYLANSGYAFDSPENALYRYSLVIRLQEWPFSDTFRAQLASWRNSHIWRSLLATHDRA